MNRCVHVLEVRPPHQDLVCNLLSAYFINPQPYAVGLKMQGHIILANDYVSLMLSLKWRGQFILSWSHLYFLRKRGCFR